MSRRIGTRVWESKCPRPVAAPMPVDDPGVVALLCHPSSFGGTANRDIGSGVVMGLEHSISCDPGFPCHVCASFGWDCRCLVVLQPAGAACCSTGALGSALVVADRHGAGLFALCHVSVC